MPAGTVNSSAPVSNSLVLAKLSHDLIEFVTTPARLLGVNAGLAYMNAIYRLRTLSDCGTCFYLEAGSGLGFDSGSGKQFHCLKYANSHYRCSDDDQGVDNESNHDPHSSEQLDHRSQDGPPIASTVYGSRLFARYLISYIKDFVDLKTLDSQLVENQAPFRLTILPDEPLLQNTCIEELERIAASNFAPLQFVNQETADRIASNGINATANIPRYVKSIADESLDHEERSCPGTSFHLKTGIERGQRDRELLQTQAFRNLKYREDAKKGSSKVYCVLKRLEQKLKSDHGMVSHFLQERYLQQWERVQEDLAWRQGVGVWRLSMLDQNWWDKRAERNPVWNHAFYDLAPEVIKRSQ